MFLITGGLGRVGDIIRSRIEILQSASLFDNRMDTEQDVLDFNALYKVIDEENIKTIIHLAEAGRPRLDERNDRDLFNLNTKGTKNVIDLAKRKDISLIYATDMNKARGDYNRAKQLNEKRIMVQVKKGHLIALPVILPFTNNPNLVTTDHLFELLLQFAIELDGEYIIDRGPEDMIYLGTEEMISDAFNDTIRNLNSLEDEIVRNEYCIRIKTKNFIDVLNRHFPDTVITTRLSSQTTEEQEFFVNKLEEYFTSLPISVLYAAKMDAVELSTI